MKTDLPSSAARAADDSTIAGIRALLGAVAGAHSGRVRKVLLMQAIKPDETLLRSAVASRRQALQLAAMGIAFADLADTLRMAAELLEVEGKRHRLAVLARADAEAVMAEAKAATARGAE